MANTEEEKKQAGEEKWRENDTKDSKEIFSAREVEEAVCKHCGCLNVRGSRASTSVVGFHWLEEEEKKAARSPWRRNDRYSGER